MAPRGYRYDGGDGDCRSSVGTGRSTQDDGSWRHGLCWSLWEMTRLDPGRIPGEVDHRHRRARVRPGVRVHPAAGDCFRHAGRRHCERTARRCSACCAISARPSACRSPPVCWRTTRRRCMRKSAPWSLRSTVPCSRERPAHCWNPASPHGAAMLDGIINQQALIIAYLDDYRLMIFTTAPALLLLFLMRRPAGVSAKADPSHAAMD